MNNTSKLAALEAIYALLPKIECQRKCQECYNDQMTRLEAKRLPEPIPTGATEILSGRALRAPQHRSASCPLLT
jgi:hypothetical protein